MKLNENLIHFQEKSTFGLGWWERKWMVSLKETQFATHWLRCRDTSLIIHFGYSMLLLPSSGNVAPFSIGYFGNAADFQSIVLVPVGISAKVELFLIHCLLPISYPALESIFTEQTGPNDDHRWWWWRNIINSLPEIPNFIRLIRKP